MCAARRPPYCRRRNHNGSHPGTLCPYRPPGATQRRNQHVPFPGLTFQRSGGNADQLSPAPIDLADAGKRVCWKREYTRRLSPRGASRVSFFLLRRLHVYCLRKCRSAFRRARSSASSTSSLLASSTAGSLFWGTSIFRAQLIATREKGLGMRKRSHDRSSQAFSGCA